MGTPRDPRSRRSLQDLHHDLRRQRLARPGRGRPERSGGSRKTMITRRELLAMAPLAGVARADGHGAMMWNYFMQELDAADTRCPRALSCPAVRTVCNRS